MFMIYLKMVIILRATYFMELTMEFIKQNFEEENIELSYGEQVLGIQSVPHITIPAEKVDILAEILS